MIKPWMAAVLLAILTVMSSCDERPVETDTSWTVGNILLSDNTVISPLGYDKDSQTAVGVIFYANGDSVFVVGTKELGKYIYSDSIGSIASVTNDTYTLCGTENTAAIMASDFRCPAVDAVNGFASPVKGWALPSAGELKMLSKNFNIVRSSMAVIGGDAFSSEQYLTSSQDGASTESQQQYYYAVSLTNGFVTSVNKTNASMVRPILRIR